MRSSDDQADFQVANRMSVMRVRGLIISANGTDAKNIRLYRDDLTKASVIEDSFDLLLGQLQTA